MNDMNDTNDTNEPTTGSDYLWDRRGAPDPELGALEAELARHRWSGRLPAGPLPARTLRRLPTLALAAGLLAAGAIGASLWWWAAAHRERLPSQSRAPMVSDAPAAGAAADVPSTAASGPVYQAVALTGELVRSELRAGERLVTDAETRARLQIGAIGSLVLEPGSTLRVERPGPDLAADADHLLWLERGELTASIFAAPRLFQLGTPSGMAVDMGCVYTARVREDGTTQLAVIAGQVSFETPERRVTVPSGASTVASPGRGPATPTWDDAPDPWRQSVARLDEAVARGPEGAPDREQALREVLATDRAGDSLTLWHLLAWGALPDGDRARVCEALQRLAPAPAGTVDAGCETLEAGALQTWRDALDWSWSATPSKAKR